MINPKNKLFRWRPIDGLPVYPEFWYAGMRHFLRDFRPGWPGFLMYCYGEKFIAIVNHENLYRKGELIIKNALLEDELPVVVLEVGRLLEFSIWGQDRRKACTWQAY